MSDELIEAIEAPRLETNSILGHDEETKILMEAWDGGRLSHAWLISGPKGIGKSTLAWRFVRRVLAPEATELPHQGIETNRDHPDIRQIIAGSHPDCRLIRRSYTKKSPYRFRTEISVEDIREAGIFLHHTAGQSAWRCIIIDAADEMNTNAQNALLKMLEEPPVRTLILLIAHAPSRLLPTIRSRCQDLNLRALTNPQIAEVLARKNTSLNESDLQIISDISDGSPGRALELAQSGGLELYHELMGLVELLPRIDAERLHAASEKFAGASGESSYRTFLEILKWWLLRHIREGATSRGQEALEPWLKAWEKIDELASRGDSVNLDRKQVVLNTFFELSAAARG
ncbi:MAG: DNA polymerase III subunit delta' [Alphaproteobacteria bacterium]|nr:DNA polymerase III subunit delta' [Alphaproteobacteria bacterium]